MAANTKCAPKSEKEYSASDLTANFKGVKFSAALNTTTTNDLLIADDSILDGAVLTVIGGTANDMINFKVIDKDNVLGLGVNKVLGQYATDWYINPSVNFQYDFRTVYPAKILTGIYLRAEYVSTSLVTVAVVIVNYRLHKVLW